MCGIEQKALWARHCAGIAARNGQRLSAGVIPFTSCGVTSADSARQFGFRHAQSFRRSPSALYFDRGACRSITVTKVPKCSTQAPQSPTSEPQRSIWSRWDSPCRKPPKHSRSAWTHLSRRGSLRRAQKRRFVTTMSCWVADDWISWRRWSRAAGAGDRAVESRGPAVSTSPLQSPGCGSLTAPSSRLGISLVPASLLPAWRSSCSRRGRAEIPARRPSGRLIEVLALNLEAWRRQSRRRRPRWSVESIPKIAPSLKRSRTLCSLCGGRCMGAVIHWQQLKSRRYRLQLTATTFCSNSRNAMQQHATKCCAFGHIGYRLFRAHR